MARRSCVIHFLDCSKTEKVKELTDTRWGKIKESALKWSDFDGPEKEISQQLILRDSFGPNDGYHPSCYNSFTHKSRLLAAEKRKAKGVTERKNTSPTKLKRISDRQRHASATTSTLTSQKRSENLLPEICLICRKNKWKIDPTTHKRNLEKLAQVSCSYHVILFITLFFFL